MTNKEAIETIKRIRFSKIEMRDCPEREALTLAIKALEFINENYPATFKCYLNGEEIRE